jgi:hypothetical protein
MARSSECTGYFAQKVLDGSDIVRDAMLPSPDAVTKVTTARYNGAWKPARKAAQARWAKQKKDVDNG